MKSPWTKRGVELAYSLYGSSLTNVGYLLVRLGVRSGAAGARLKRQAKSYQQEDQWIGPLHAVPDAPADSSSSDD